MDETNTETPADARAVLEAADEPQPAPDPAPEEAFPRHRRWLIPLLVTPLVLVILVVAAWAIDTGLGGVPRNVQLAGINVGGNSEEQLLPSIRSMAEGFTGTSVEVVTGNVTYRTTAAEIGLTVDQDRTASSAMDVGSDGFVLRKPFEWVGSFLTPRTAPLRLQVSEEQVAVKLIELEGDSRMAPTEPRVEVVEGALHVVPGTDGRGIDPRRVSVSLRAAASSWRPGQTIRAEVPRGPIPPLGSTQEARAATSAAESLVGDSIEIRTSTGNRTLEPRTLRTWVGLESHADGSVTAGLDPRLAAAGLRQAFADIDDRPVDAGFTVEGGVPMVRAGRNGQVCCSDTSAETVESALRAGDAYATLELVEGPPAFTAADAGALGIKQAVGGTNAWRDGRATVGPPGFTTYHSASGARVINIHRIADLVRGAVIAPGDTFSINDHVGKRTTAKGFVAAGAISNGEHVDEIGGGISQFATTTFNAAFFAALDINESQAHSEYFDRYPRGREATMGFPAPDLRFTNNTPYGILIWPTYTSTSLTVTLYSTPWATAEQTAITEGTSGSCKIVTTTRTRTFPDGHTEHDKFRARYRPGPGQGC